MPCLYGYLSQPALEEMLQTGENIAEPGCNEGRNLRVIHLEGIGAQMTTMVTDARPELDASRRRGTARPLTVSIRLALSVLVLTVILSTAAVCSFVWWRTAQASPTLPMRRS